MQPFLNRTSKAVLGIGSVLAVLLSGVPVAQAAPVANWNYTVTSEWVPASTVFSGPAGVGGQQINNTSEISWGLSTGLGGSLTPSGNRSGVVISNSPAVGVIATDGAAAATQTITHTNNPISASYGTLTSASLLTTLTLTDPTPPPTGLPSQSITFGINFSETSNAAPCGFPSGSTCDDIFVIDLGSLNQSFVYDGYTYFTSIITELGALTPLDPLTCSTAGAAAGCLGFQTPEGQATAERFAFLITSQPVNIPEPESLSLLAFALLGSTAMARRKGRPS